MQKAGALPPSPTRATCANGREAHSLLRACLGAQACQACQLSRRDGRSGQAGSLPAGGQQRLGTHNARCWRSGRGRSASHKDVEKPGYGERLFPSDSVLFACCNKARVHGNSSGLQYTKFCSLCQGWCRQFQEMIPVLLPGEQNVLLRDFTVIKIVPVANFKKLCHLNVRTMTNFRLLLSMV